METKVDIKKHCTAHSGGHECYGTFKSNHFITPLLIKIMSDNQAPICEVKGRFIKAAALLSTVWVALCYEVSKNGDGENSNYIVLLSF